MSSFIEDGASEISSFASIPLNDAFRRLPTSTHTFIGFSMVIFRYDTSVRSDSGWCGARVTAVACSCLCGRPRFDGPREVGLALFQESRERLFCVFGADLRAELLVLGLHRRLDLLAKWLLHEPLAGLQRCGRLRCQFPGRFGRSRQHVLVGYDLGNQTQLRSAPGIKGSSQQNQIRGTDMTDPRRYRAARSEFRYDGKIDEGHLEFRALARVDEVAVRQHGGATADGGAVDRRDQWLVEVDQYIHEAGLWRFAWPWRILEKILDIVARTERISRAMPEDDTRVLVIRRLVEDACERQIHG